MLQYPSSNQTVLQAMSLDYIRRTNQLFYSDVLNKSVFIDELPDLSDYDLDRLIVEAEVSCRYLREDYKELPNEDPNRTSMKHKYSVRRAYRQQAEIEKALRGVDRQEQFYHLVAKQIGKAEAEAIMERAKG
jgi:hypothetical protein